MACPFVVGTFSRDALAEPASRKVVLSGEEPQLALRLQAVDRLLDPLDGPDMIAQAVAQACSPLAWLPAASTAVLLRNTPERWEQAAEEYERLIREGETALVATRRSVLIDSESSVQARRAGHERIARLPPSLLENYRRRVDASARRLLEIGRAERDESSLRRLVDEMFCSRPAEEALSLLGDLAFERGQFAEARSWWRYLARPLAADRLPDAGLLHPAGETRPALARAKQILATVFLGEADEARSELKHFREVHGKSTGHLAGRSGNLADILESVWQDAARREFFQGDRAWTTFAGDVSRHTTLRRPLHSRLWVDGPTWRVPLPGPVENAPILGPLPQPGFHPIVIGQQVLVADAHTVYAFHLLSGKLLWQVSPKQLAEDEPVKFPVKNRHGSGIQPSFTLSSDGERVFVHFASGGARVPNDDAHRRDYLVCLELKEDKSPRQLWHVRSDQSVRFEGAPLVSEGRVYVAQTKMGGPRWQTSLVCFDAGTGQRRWTREVCEAPEYEDGTRPRSQQHLLTLAGSQIVYCSHTGAIAAVDAGNGRRLWAVRYPRRGQYASDGAPSPRSVTPCIAHQDRLFAAPLDSDRLLCLDSASGTVLWERQGIEVVHLLGAAGNRLFLATTHGMRAIEANSGGDEGGWMQPSVGKLPSLGRGLLAGGWIYWPTQDPQLPYRAVRQGDGSQESDDGTTYDPTQLRGLVAGNMVFAHDCLVVAGARELVAYVPPRHFLDRLQQTRDPSPAGRYRLAQALADAGKAADATGIFRELARESKEWTALAHRRLAELGLQPPMKNPAAQARRVVRQVKVAKPVSKDFVKLPLRITWQIENEQLLEAARVHGDSVLSVQGKHLSCRETETGVSRWTEPVDFRPSWTARHADVLLLTSPQGIQGRDIDRGNVLWLFPVEPYGRVHLEGDRPVFETDLARLGSCALSDGRLFFLQDGRRIFALDAGTGHVLWTRWAPGGDMRPLHGGGSFGPHLAVTGQRLLVQTSDGKRLILSTANGQTLNESSSAGLWTSAPLVVAPRQVCIAEPGGQITMLDIESGQETWRYAFPWPTSVTGVPAKLLSADKIVLALVDANYGQELIALDAHTGKALWPRSMLLPADFDLNGACTSGPHLFVSRANQVQCISLSDGKVLWQRTMPGNAQRWRLTILGEALAAQPESPPNLAWLTTGPGSLSYPLAWRSPPAEFSVWLLDRRDGSPLQQLAPGSGTGRALISPQGIIVNRHGRLMAYRDDSPTSRGSE